MNFLLVGIYIVLLYSIHFLFFAELERTASEIIGFFVAVVFLLFSMLLLDFVIRKNSLNQLNTFGILVFSTSAMMFPDLVGQYSLVVANVFLLLALRRIYSLQSLKNSEKKIVDATLWIVLASVFYFWSLLLLLSLYFAILIKPRNHFRYFLIPLVSLLGALLIATAYHFVIDDSFKWFASWLTPVSFDFSAYGNPKIWTAITFFSAVLIWTIVSMFRGLASVPKKDRPNQVQTLVTVAVGILLVALSPNKSGNELLFLFAPAAIVVASFMERNKERWFREILLWGFVLLPVVLLFVN
ncbi:MAG: hypothetical protein HKO54_08270 [Flavobacteriaceae bacterium]|nr:hypothetical protein [Flavobacteriaceae bacterium]